jgi:hypothetical protein
VRVLSRNGFSGRREHGFSGGVLFLSVAMPAGCRIASTSLRRGPRKILRLVYYEGMTYKAAAVHVGVPLGTAKSWVRHSLVRLKGLMQR